MFMLSPACEPGFAMPSQRPRLYSQSLCCTRVDKPRIWQYHSRPKLHRWLTAETGHLEPFHGFRHLNPN